MGKSIREIWCRGFKEKETKYSVQFKLYVLSFMKKTRSSVVETALQFGLTNPSMITAWKNEKMNFFV
jgi:transposase-like protein